MRTNNINICHHFLRYVVEEKDIYIEYIRSKENPAVVMMMNFLNLTTTKM